MPPRWFPLRVAGSGVCLCSPALNVERRFGPGGLTGRGDGPPQASGVCQVPNGIVYFGMDLPAESKESVN